MLALADLCGNVAILALGFLGFFNLAILAFLGYLSPWSSNILTWGKFQKMGLITKYISLLWDSLWGRKEEL
jgi:hypothetical protein